MTRLSTYLLPTEKQAPADAEALSHKLLVRAGMARQLGTGLWTYLPAGWKVHENAVQIVRGLNTPWVNYVFCAPHAFHLSDGVGDVRRMMTYAGAKLQHVHVADCFNHRANIGNRYIMNPPGVDARIHQHNEIGNGEVDWDEFFSTLRDVRFDGVATVCVFGWEEEADAIHRRMLERVTSELRV